MHTSIYKEETLMIFREVNVGFVVFNLMLDILFPTFLGQGSILQSVSMCLSSRPPVSDSPSLLSICAFRTQFVEIKDRYVAYEVTNTQTCSNFLVSKEIEEHWLSVCCLLQSFREARKPGG